MRGERDRWDKVCPMKCVTQHPIHAEENRLKRALTHCGFRQIDDGEAPELIPLELTHELFYRHNAPRPLLVEGGHYALRCDGLTSLLPSLEGSLLPLRAFAAGKIYDGGDRTLPCHNWIEGVVADQLLTPETLEALWRRIRLMTLRQHVVWRIGTMEQSPLLLPMKNGHGCLQRLARHLRLPV